MRGLENDNIARFETENEYNIPDIFPYREKVDCKSWIVLSNAVTRYRGNEGIHFYEDDYKIQRIWNNPQKYIGVLKKYKYVIQPDFSLYYDFPKALQIYNKYRNHWLSAYYSTEGIEIIPNISLSTPECYDFTFIGYPKGSVVAFSDIGSKRDTEAREIVNQAYDEMIKRLEPIQILYFTRSKKNAPSEADVIEINYIKEMINNGKR